jgi:hypothetical protein
MTTFEGKCVDRKLRITINEGTLTVEPLSGHQSGSIFTHALSDLKKKPDVVIDSSTHLRAIGLIVSILSGFIGISCALNWGRGLTVPCFWICVALFLAAFAIIKYAPKRKTLLWTTTAGVQVFGLDETKKNHEAIRHFQATLESLIRTKQ